MRTRDRDQDWIEELGRRRLEALIAELTPPGDADPAVAPADAGDESPRDEAPRGAGPFDDEPPTGRHARRPLTVRGRLSGWLADRLPQGLTPAGLHSGHVGVVALLLAVAVVLGGWGLVRASGDTPTPPAAAPSVRAPAPSPGSLTSPSGAAGGADESPAEVVVHVAGKVKRPGIVVLPTGSRVVDAVRRAGGFAPGVGPRSAALNLARVLVDGEQIVVGGAAAAPAGPVVPGGAPGAAPTGALVSLNTADQTTLESLPGVGPVTAAAILQWRTDHGPFTAVEQLLEVSGIGEATLAEIEPHVTL